MPFAALGLLSFLLAWLVPNHYPPWVSFHGEALMFLALIACAAALALNGALRGFDPVLGPLLALLALVWLQWAAGLIAYHGDALVSSLYLVGFGLAWTLGSNSARLGVASTHLRWIATLTITAAVASVFIAALQWLGSAHDVLGVLAAEREPWGRPFANLAQPNHLATLLLMAVVLTLLLNQQGRLNDWQAWVLLGWLSFGLTMAESRAGWLSALVVGGFLLWQARRVDCRPVRARRILSWWTLLLALALLWQPLNQLMLLSTTRPVATIMQDSGRLLMWRQMLAGVEQSPWWGYGWRQTVVGQKAGALQVPGSQATDYAHTIVLDLALWVGAPLAVLLLALATWWLLRAVRRVSNSTQLLCLAAVLPVGVHSLVEFPFAYSYFLFPVAWLLGIVTGQQRGTGARPPTVRAERAVWAIALAGYAALCAWTAAEYWQAEEDHRVMRFELRNLGQRPAEHEVPDLLLLDQLGTMLTLARELPRAGMSAEEIERIRIASRSFSWATMDMRYAMALGLNGQPEEAGRVLERLRTFYGEASYQQARTLFLDARDKRYPQLAAVPLP